MVQKTDKRGGTIVNSPAAQAAAAAEAAPAAKKAKVSCVCGNRACCFGNCCYWAMLRAVALSHTGIMIGLTRVACSAVALCVSDGFLHACQQPIARWLLSQPGSITRSVDSRHLVRKSAFTFRVARNCLASHGHCEQHRVADADGCRRG